MSELYVVAIDGLSAYRTLETIPETIKRNALMAVNKTAERARTASSKAIREQVAYTAQYLNDGRLTLDKAKTFDDAAIINSRFRPTSLARFVRSGTVGGKRGVSVQVAPGMARRSRQMFLIRLRAGNELTETKNNLGLAIRLKPGEVIDNKKKLVKMATGLYLLYGPSVSDVFRSVAEDEAPAIAERLAGEFSRLMEVFS